MLIATRYFSFWLKSFLKHLHLHSAQWPTNRSMQKKTKNFMHTANFFSLPKIKSMTIQNVHFINLLDVEYFIINGKSIHKSVGNGVFIKWNSLKIWNSNFYSQKKVAASMDVNYIIWIFVCWMYVCLQKTRHWLSYFIIQSLMILWWDDSRLCWYFYVPI